MQLEILYTSLSDELICFFFPLCFWSSRGNSNLQKSRPLSFFKMTQKDTVQPSTMMCLHLLSRSMSCSYVWRYFLTCVNFKQVFPSFGVMNENHFILSYMFWFCLFICIPPLSFCQCLCKFISFWSRTSSYKCTRKW